MHFGSLNTNTISKIVYHVRFLLNLKILVHEKYIEKASKRLMPYGLLAKNC